MSHSVIHILSGTNMGGATLSYLTLLDGLISHGINVIVVIPNNKGPLSGILNKKGIRYYVLPIQFYDFPKTNNWIRKFVLPLLLLRKYLLLSYNIVRLIDIARSEHAELIHTNVSPVYEGHVAAKLLHIPHIWHIREYGDLDFNIHIIPNRETHIRRLKEDYTIAITTQLQDYYHLTDYAKSFMVYNGVRKKQDWQFYNNREILYLCVSRISPEKGIETVIHAWEAFITQIPGARLFLLGEGQTEYVEYIQRLIEQKKLQSSISMLGYQEDVDSFLRRAKALIVASPFEGFGRMTAEACFAGCIVIGRNTAGTKEILDKTGGLLFSTLEELIQQMTNVALMSKQEYEERTHRAQQIAALLYSEEQYIDQIFSIYQHLLEHEIIQ